MEYVVKVVLTSIEVTWFLQPCSVGDVSAWQGSVPPDSQGELGSRGGVS